jgi:hypothetical protein
LTPQSISLDSDHWIQDQKVLVSSEREFKDRHRGDVSRSRFINAKQSKNKSALSGSRRSTGLGVPIPQGVLGVAKPRKLGYVSLTLRHWAMHHKLLPHDRQRKILTLDGQTAPVIFFWWGGLSTDFISKGLCFKS